MCKPTAFMTLYKPICFHACGFMHSRVSTSRVCTTSPPAGPLYVLLQLLQRLMKSWPQCHPLASSVETLKWASERKGSLLMSQWNKVMFVVWLLWLHVQDNNSETNQLLRSLCFAILQGGAIFGVIKGFLFIKGLFFIFR